MIRTLTAAAGVALMTACGDGQPLLEDPQTALEEEQALDLPPGTEDAAADGRIFRFEERDGEGGGLVTDVTYNARDDTFTVDNLGFDGPNRYGRAEGRLATLGRARVFIADEVTPDAVTGKPVGQATPYVALYGASAAQIDGAPQVSYAIVRTGAFQNNGFGGYVYERNGGVTLPTTGQATFSGDYAGLRIFNPGKSGLEYVTGDMTLDIDFEDFNANDAVKGFIRNRRFFDQNGDRIVTGDGEGFLKGPDLAIVVEEGTPSLNADGEIEVTMRNYVFDETGRREVYEEGTFTGIASGDLTRRPGGRIVGVVKVTAEDPREEGTFMQETGGVILSR